VESTIVFETVIKWRFCTHYNTLKGVIEGRMGALVGSLGINPELNNYNAGY